MATFTLEMLKNFAEKIEKGEMTVDQAALKLAPTTSILPELKWDEETKTVHVSKLVAKKGPPRKFTREELYKLMSQEFREQADKFFNDLDKVNKVKAESLQANGPAAVS